MGNQNHDAMSASHTNIVQRSHRSWRRHPPTPCKALGPVFIMGSDGHGFVYSHPAYLSPTGNLISLPSSWVC